MPALHCFLMYLFVSATANLCGRVGCGFVPHAGLQGGVPRIASLHQLLQDQEGALPRPCPGPLKSCPAPTEAGSLEIRVYHLGSRAFVQAQPCTSLLQQKHSLAHILCAEFDYPLSLAAIRGMNLVFGAGN